MKHWHFLACPWIQSLFGQLKPDSSIHSAESLVLFHISFTLRPIRTDPPTLSGTGGITAQCALSFKDWRSISHNERITCCQALNAILPQLSQFHWGGGSLAAGLLSLAPFDAQFLGLSRVSGLLIGLLMAFHMAVRLLLWGCSPVSRAFLLECHCVLLPKLWCSFVVLCLCESVNHVHTIWFHLCCRKLGMQRVTFHSLFVSERQFYENSYY